MSELLVTQCPYCQTRFRLSQQHLNAAAGNVRCGACLKVFNASPPPGATPPSTAPDARPDDSPQPEPPPQPAASAPGVIAPRQGTLLIHDDLDFDELDLEALGLDESLIDEVNPRQPLPGPIEAAAPGPDPRADAPTLHDSAEPGTDANVQPDVAELEGPSTPVHDLDAEFDLELDPVADAARVPDPDDAPDPLLDLHEDFVSSAVQDFGPRPRDPALDNEAPEPADEAPAGFGLPRSGSPLRPLAPAPEAQGIYLRDRPDYVTPTLAWHEPSDDPPEPVTPAQPAPAPRSKVARLFGAEPEFEAEPEPEIGELDLPELREEPELFEEPPRPPSRRRRTWLWGSLSAAAAIMLVVQFIAYNFTALAHDQRTRPMLATACLLAGCELPPRVDITRLRSSNLTVRAHPEFPNALAVDVILYNRADFTQPFPVLRMRFTDSHGREVASRRFRPEEYLSGELAGARLMPLQTPIHVGLSMLDPGENAVGYSLDFESP